MEGWSAFWSYFFPPPIGGTWSGWMGFHLALLVYLTACNLTGSMIGHRIRSRRQEG